MIPHRNQHVRSKSGGEPNRLLAGVDSAGFEPALVQNDGKRICNYRLIVSNKNPGLHWHNVPPFFVLFESDIGWFEDGIKGSIDAIADLRSICSIPFDE